MHDAPYAAVCLDLTGCCAGEGGGEFDHVMPVWHACCPFCCNASLLNCLVVQAALVAGESMLTFAFAAVALETAFQNGHLKPFGFATSDSKK